MLYTTSIPFTKEYLAITTKQSQHILQYRQSPRSFCLAKTIIDELFILSEFNRIINSSTVRYNNKEEIIEYIDGELNLCLQQHLEHTEILIIFSQFQFLLTSTLAKKPTIKLKPSAVNTINELSQKREGSDISTYGFEIGEINTTHILVANKFCWVRPHLMLITSDGY